MCAPHLREAPAVWHEILMLRGILIGAIVVGGVGSAGAQPKSTAPPLVGATEIVKKTAPTGFIDDAIASDETRLAYVVGDASTGSELHLVNVATQAETVVDLAAVTVHPISVALFGPRVFVVGQNEDGAQIAALVEPTADAAKPTVKSPPKIVYKLGPATDITVVTRDGKPRIALHRATSAMTGMKHEVELDAVETGKRVAAGHAIELDGKDANKKLELTVNHWSDGYTRAHGIKGGEWEKKEDQRSPDVEATYDLVAGKFVEQTKIEDLFAQHKRFQTLAEVHDRVDFLHMTWDNSTVQIWRAGKPVGVTLDQPINNYDPKSLQGFVAADGSAWFVLKTDPVNPDAVARKKADPEYVDVFHATADGKAERKARVLETGVRVRFGTMGSDRFWLLERSSGFERGGKTLTLYGFGS
jgi:hypothetical protein